MKVMKASAKNKFARMDETNRAMCFAYRNPGKDGTPMKYEDIQKLVSISKPLRAQGIKGMGAWDLGLIGNFK